jgi:hypothetical protein
MCCHISWFFDVLKACHPRWIEIAHHPWNWASQLNRVKRWNK